MKSQPNCKINLGLRVLRKRPDGYHDLASVFLPVPLCDELEITPLSAADAPADGLLFSQGGIPVDCDLSDNICVKAYRLLKADFPQMPPVKMHLQKNIPFGAGLGGGSSDASFTLRMLNQLCSLGLTSAQLRSYATRLGADCAFFVDNQPAYVTGIGDRLSPLPFNPLQGYRLLLVKPNEAVSTREAYAGLHLSVAEPDAYERATDQSPLIQALASPVETWKETVVNDFEETVFPLHPAIAELKACCYRHGARYASMSGSGATVFALFAADRPIPETLLSFIQSQGYFHVALPGSLQ